MFAKLTGTVDALAEDHLILDVGGVGYLVQGSSRMLAGLSAGAAARLFIETQVGEDHIRLYGFAEPAEQRWFKLLQSVQGVGAKVALAILSVMAPEELARVIAAQDKAMVGRANGVGPKLAQRIVTELKDKAAALAVGLAPVPLAAVPAAGTGAGADAVSALINLGYRPAEAAGAVAQALAVLGADASFDGLVRAGLKTLAPADKTG